MRAKLTEHLTTLFKDKLYVEYTITEEVEEKHLIKYITEFDINQVPYFIVRVKEKGNKSILVFDKELNLISSIS